jgi:hypothetical protein
MFVESRDGDPAAVTSPEKLLSELITWPERGGRWTFLNGVPAAGQIALADAMEAALCEAGMNVVVLPSVPHGFETFAGARALLSWLRPVLDREAPELVAEARDQLGWLLEHDAGDGAEMQRVAETIVFAITRRISRESHHSSIEIDALARLLLDAAQRCPSLQPGLALIIKDVEHWDRPSLRCLHRVLRLATAADRLVIITAAGDWQVAGEHPDSFQGWVTRARSRFFAGLAAHSDFSVHRVGSDTSEPPHWSLGSASTQDSDLLIETGAALGYQNYERVYLLCDALLERATNDEQRAQANRLIGVAHAQTGEIAASEEQMVLALEQSSDPPFRAHLEYLIGLLSTKRLYDLDAAADHYRRGERILDAWGVTSDEERVERAWLWNGEALVYTLQAKELSSGAEREALYRESFRLELKAYELVRGMKTPAASYLRHNLLANITFLLEISRRFAEAVEFWSRAFERYLAADSRVFAAAFDARLGVLLFKEGRGDEALDVLERAHALCHAEGDLFYEERACLALGYVAFHSGAHERALAAFSAGARLAIRLRDETAYQAHLAGVLWSLAAGGDVETFEQAVTGAARGGHAGPWLETLVTEIKAGHDPSAALKRAEVTIPPPSPKMPSYIPSIDLEGAPARDLNRYLVFGTGPLHELA